MFCSTSQFVQPSADFVMAGLVREHEAQLVINISWKAMIARFCGGIQKTLKCLYPKGKLFF